MKEERGMRENLKAARKGKGMTQQVMADRLGQKMIGVSSPPAGRQDAG